MYKTTKIINPPFPIKLAWLLTKKAVDRKMEERKQIEVDYSWPTNMYV